MSQILPDWQTNLIAQAEVLAVHFAIAQALTERLHPANLIPATIAYLQQQFPAAKAGPLPLIDHLDRVQTWLHEPADLATVLATWLPTYQSATSAAAIALAFYCFLSTAEDPQLSLRRAARSPRSARLICALAGALSGAYNSPIGLPLPWRWLSAPPALEPTGNEFDPQFSQLAHRLLAVWAGVYDPGQFAVAAIAAPGVIRPR